MLQKITPFLTFDGDAEEAAVFETGLFPDSKIATAVRGPEGGRAATVAFALFGQDFLALDACGPHLAFNEADSFAVSCETQNEAVRFWDALVEGGEPSRCGWPKDRFGLSWQIVPTLLGERMADPERAPRTIQAMMGVPKLDVATLEAAAEAPSVDSEA